MRCRTRGAAHTYKTHDLPIRQHWEGELQEVGIIDGKANQDAHKLKLHAHVNLRGPEPVQTGVLVQLEHAVVGVKHFSHQELEELLHMDGQIVALHGGFFIFSFST